MWWFHSKKKKEDRNAKFIKTLKKLHDHAYHIGIFEKKVLIWCKPSELDNVLNILADLEIFPQRIEKIRNFYLLGMSPGMFFQSVADTYYGSEPDEK